VNMIRKVLELPNDSRAKTLIVALALCLVCSVLVSTAAVALKPLQEANKALDKKRNILNVAGMTKPGASIDELFSTIEQRVVDMETGSFADDVDPETYDQRKAAKDPAMSRVLSKDEDIASIRRQARYATVYLVRDGEQVKTIILPVHGYGLWSTMYGFVALEGDANTVKGLSFYAHAETPGLGGEVDNPSWRAQWSGREIFNAQGEVAIELVKGGVGPTTPNAQHKIDALAGATLTSRGVENLIRYWLGEQGFRPFLNNLVKKG
jgi:Na+-transporting NADH:ubiquinone oxidoreductase subunit C